ncbi:type III flagellar switch regulator (C-ring) FliN [Pseudomonas sp. SJZ085]|uniref:FliM/FliN family flagellar motor switch protein n=1 Tax=unclassified Pseudomonas TaxID=196821 RepID=UPI00119B1E9C|nr:MULTISPECIES: FliM/FliN family flagellar motor C-terminal domain-containing protein [unclassified Pseudomonas]TWC11289.1 type III flagellar switch regulator (C-ring) FliN [Pseudomonas sp. SJZ074]TWC29808.1 type III flagellar switch regulator (C-ring) FliN [Pseudomonas sp. SJZ085]
MRMLGFVGTTRLRTARDRLPAVIRHWYEQWCFSDERHPCEVNCSALDDARELASTEGWLRARSAHGSISLAGDWRSIVFGPAFHDAPEDESARYLLHEAQLALVNTLLEALGQSGVSLLVADPSRPFSDALNARVLLRLQVGQLTLSLLLDAALLNAELEPPVPRKPLLERKQALGNARVKLSVRLPLASLSIGEMRDLRPGDTLRAGALLADPVSLRVADGPVVASGYLAKQRDQLAVQLISNE